MSFSEKYEQFLDWRAEERSPEAFENHLQELDQRLELEKFFEWIKAEYPDIMVEFLESA